MKVTRTEHQIQVNSPYNPDLPAAARKIGGKWHSGNKIWIFDIRDEGRVEALYRGIYGEWPSNNGDSAPSETVTARVTVNSIWSAYNAGLFLFGRQIARATGRDSGARMGDGIVVLEGEGFYSGGSMKNWRTFCSKGTIFEVRDIPKLAYEKCVFEEGTIEIVDENINRNALLEEREALMKRLSEIDQILNS